MKIGDYQVTAVNNGVVSVGCIVVTRREVEQVLKLMDEWKPAPKFKVGDFVRVLRSYSSVVPAGACGKVLATRVEVTPGGWPIAVEFPEHIPDAHNCRGLTKYGHGYWFDPNELELVD